MSTTTTIKYNGTTISSFTGGGSKTLPCSGQIMSGDLEIVVSESRLPDGFQEVEYIQSSGTQYIDTNYYIVATTGAKVIALATVMGGYVGMYVLGTQYTTSPYPYFSIKLAYNKFSFEYGGGITSEDGSASIDTKYTMQMNYKNDGALKVDNTTYLASGVYFASGNNYPLVISADNLNGSIQRYGSYKFYSIEITEGSNVVRNYVPCYCTTTVTAYQGSTQTTAASGTIGLYDLVNSRFYINSGSGTFTKGPDV